MGSRLCCMRRSQRSKEATCSTIVIIKSPAKTRKRVYEEAKEVEQGVERGSITLNDWLLQSPNNNLGYHAMNPTKLQVVNAGSPPHQVMSSPEVRSAEFYTPRISFSLENRCGNLEMVDERDENEDEALIFTPTLKENGSQKLKKKVSFRFPKEADIFIFYSPEEKFEDR
ncbi:hypothetical protein CTI12_AA385910 [Artemisia annua]|uniref:Uncharacterized protein n=1 Tax=Artemisia annua TaxID=35608 RepID=A0A2U1MFJ1_ARTAN|nr:hypothetical protein CTI12_AA385910 [Artemisia annua]